MQEEERRQPYPDQAACESAGHAVVAQGAAIGRRSFLGGLLALGSAAVGALLAVPVLRYILYPVYSKNPDAEWSAVGDAAELQTSKGPSAKTITFARLDGWREVVSSQTVYVGPAANGKLVVLSAICPHLGCSVSWHESRGRFVCPCHGGQFGPDGQRISGPPPRGLDQLPTRVKDGKLEVRFRYFRPNVPNQEPVS